MPLEPTEAIQATSASLVAARTGGEARSAVWKHRLLVLGPALGLVLLCLAGMALNKNFATWDNLMNVLTRTAFIGIISVGMCFVIIGGGIDLSVGSMAGLIAGSVILVMNGLHSMIASPVLVVAVGALVALALGALFGLAQGLVITKGRVEPFIATLGTMGIFRAYLTYLANGGAITLGSKVSDVYSPVSGTVVEVNSALADKPETINEDAYGDGWLCVIELSNKEEVNDLLDPDDYDELLEEEDN